MALNNYDLTLPKIANKLGKNGECIHYLQVTSTGSWELSIETKNAGEIWCWFNECRYVVKKDENGKEVYDEEKQVYVYDYVKVAEGVETFAGSEKFCKIRGNAGITFVPMEYTENKGTKRYAVVRLYRSDTGEERIMNIVQNS